MGMLTRVGGGLLALTLAVGAVPASAAPKSKERSATFWIREGDRLYNSGKYREAAEALKKAYAKDPESTLLYNIARAYDQSGDLAEALEYYQKFVDTDPEDAVLVKRAMLALDRLNPLLKKAEQAQEERARLEADRKRAEEEAAAAEKERQEVLARQLKEEAARQRRAQTNAYIAAGGAAAGVGVGVLFGILSTVARSSFTGAIDVEKKDEARGSTQTFAVIADVSYLIGAGAGVATYLLWPKGPKVDAPAEEAAADEEEEEAPSRSMRNKVEDEEEEEAPPARSTGKKVEEEEEQPADEEEAPKKRRYKEDEEWERKWRGEDSEDTPKPKRDSDDFRSDDESARLILVPSEVTL